MSHTTIEFKYNGQRCTVEELDSGERWYYNYDDPSNYGLAHELKDEAFKAEADRVFELETSAIGNFLHSLTH